MMATTDPTDPTLAALLAWPLRRGMRCDGCAHWQPDSDGHGACEAQDERESTSAHDGCVYWSPRAGCGLDYNGIPLASPLADKE